MSHHGELHERLQEVLPLAVLDPGAGDVAALEAHATAGCSLCARALVNARDVLGDLALAASPGAPPAPAARELDADRHRRTRERLLESAGAAARSPSGGAAGARVVDPSATVAHAHILGPSEAARLAEIERIGAWEPREGDGVDALLAEVERAVRFPILFVSIVRGDRVGYRAQRGLPPELAVHRDMRREMTFCTHCVGGDQPLVVRDAVAEAFFRGSRMVSRFGVRAYVGVPLRTSRAITIGTVCALDREPREIEAAHVRLLEAYAPRIAAAIESPR